MRWHINKLILMAATPLLAISVETNAAQMTTYDNRCQPQVCCPEMSCGCLTIQADALFWKAIGSNINYVADYDQQFSDVTRFKSKIKSLNYDNDVGFRVGARYNMACSCWSSAFLWTHFSTDADGKTSPMGKKFSSENKSLKTDYKVKAHWDLDLDYWDLLLSRDIVSNDCLDVRFSLGVRGLRTMQRYKSFAEFESVRPQMFAAVVQRAVSANTEATISDLDIKERHKFLGAGPRIALDFNSNIWCGFGIYGSAAVSGIVGYSKHDIENCKLLTVESSNIGPEIEQFNFAADQTIDDRSERLQANRAMTDLAIGLSWDPNIQCGYCNSVVFTFGWEHHAIFGQKHIVNGRDQSIAVPVALTEFSNFEIANNRNAGKCNSTLATYGFVFSARLTF